MVNFMLSVFKSCQTKHSSPSCHNHKETTSDPPCTTTPSPSKQAPHRSSFKSHVSFVAAKLYGVVSPRSKPPYSDNNGLGIRFPVPPFEEKKNCHKIETNSPKNVTTSFAYSHRFSTSYTMDDRGEGEQRPEVLGSHRRSFSDVAVRSRHNVGGRGQVSPDQWGSPTRLSAFKKLMPCKVEGKVKESFVVVKRSEMPYEDFKKSMIEMIVENQMYEESELKQLLQCFLSLNSWYHHGVIMEAFSEIWSTMFLDR